MFLTTRCQLVVCICLSWRAFLPVVDLRTPPVLVDFLQPESSVRFTPLFWRCSPRSVCVLSKELGFMVGSVFGAQANHRP